MNSNDCGNTPFASWNEFTDVSNFFASTGYYLAQAIYKKWRAPRSFCRTVHRASNKGRMGAAIHLSTKRQASWLAKPGQQLYTHCRRSKHTLDSICGKQPTQTYTFCKEVFKQISVLSSIFATPEVIYGDYYLPVTVKEDHTGMPSSPPNESEAVAEHVSKASALLRSLSGLPAGDLVFDVRAKHQVDPELQPQRSMLLGFSLMKWLQKVEGEQW